MVMKKRSPGESYEVVKAKNWAEAVANCGWDVGDLLRVVSIVAIANTDETYTVYPLFERVGKRR